MTKENYYNSHFFYIHESVMKIFNGDGKKHSIPKNDFTDAHDLYDEGFYHHSSSYHVRKAIKHIIKGCFVRLDKDSGQQHWSHAVLRLTMAQKVRER